MRDTDEGDEANAGEAEGYDDEWPSALMSIGKDGEENCADDAENIDRHRQELRTVTFLAQHQSLRGGTHFAEE